MTFIACRANDEILQQILASTVRLCIG